ncbi:MAG: alpha-1,4 polygalactosaminidase [Mesorhizobium sp.]|uniref:Z1 domain-containing protein n=1 Tax=Mesorhizobium sp. TaxID=1871066 RepID=UPI000FE727A0|nr:Z1 domain-containing protein [Mesorhizobium sp.]RWG42968.1 MAG: alpha-1,4 polygalactosaminidase [Mesorhizobium sp.]RWI28741.1 MAG: alpha-1,4 polygalactosaminidase [Mesorhizobium sp.]RWK45487.1 MAG: alpha-1,4 polygalactosaminidase [Mesorhizobium sp.]RWK91712.1 MAG: alpha-1,4 polygalactosaminidase [Mesorhizobium sp.]TIP58000.1 MAG: alpha-1,4 polygalactosaminidase [Mesorhizobium sp.]
MSDSQAVVIPIQRNLQPGARWQPEVGEEARDLVARKLGHESQETQDQLLESAASILSKSANPHAGRETGLVVGYVQSGKTLSFSTVMALARDNGFQLVIVVAGISKPLLNQSTQRLRRDLRIDDVDGPLRWKLYTNPTDNENNRRHIQQTLQDWRDPDVAQSERATVLVTVMKQYRHLRALVTLLQNLDLAGVPTLIVDDEADQASLNTLVARGRQSTTYRRLLEMRDAIPNHTYLQYTATPQAPLLINIIDALSPGFVEVLEPGTDYTGGRLFFDGANDLVEVIDPQDISTDANPLFDPPESLLQALRVFLLGVAAGQAEGRSARNTNRSMLVHPSQRTDSHAEYRRWIGDVFDEWQRILGLPEGDADRNDLLEDFQSVYVSLSATVDGLLPFAELSRRLPRAFRDTKIEEVNARGRQTPIIDWSQSYGWILVGGQAMDRGFTVEGLTVTYMPRGPGVGNADTVQQRGRFFGYKRRYLGFCRAYLELDALTAFQDYVEHEEFMRRQLQEIQRSGRPLRDWKRAFVLSPDLQPCRRSVLQHEYTRGDYGNRWFYPSVALAPGEVIHTNREVVEAFLATIQLETNPDMEQREAAQRHLFCGNLSLARVIDDLIVPFRVTGAQDTRELIGVMLQLSEALRANEQEVCTVYHMSPEFPRQRATDENGKINELFQGPTRLASGAYSYPGDSAFHDADAVTIQIHRLNLRQEGVVVAENVPVIAIWLPARFAVDWIAQHQAG